MPFLRRILPAGVPLAAGAVVLSVPQSAHPRPALVEAVPVLDLLAGLHPPATLLHAVLLITVCLGTIWALGRAADRTTG